MNLVVCAPKIPKLLLQKQFVGLRIIHLKKCKTHKLVLRDGDVGLGTISARASSSQINVWIRDNFYKRDENWAYAKLESGQASFCLQLCIHEATSIPGSWIVFAYEFPQICTFVCLISDKDERYVDDEEIRYVIQNKSLARTLKLKDLHTLSDILAFIRSMRHANEDIDWNTIR